MENIPGQKSLKVVEAYKVWIHVGNQLGMEGSNIGAFMGCYGITPTKPILDYNDRGTKYDAWTEHTGNKMYENNVKGGLYIVDELFNQVDAANTSGTATGFLLEPNSTSTSNSQNNYGYQWSNDNSNGAQTQTPNYIPQGN